MTLISKLTAQLVLPPAALLLLAAAGGLLMANGSASGAGLLAGALTLLWLFAMPGLAQRLAAHAERFPPLPSSPPGRQAIVVLGRGYRAIAPEYGRPYLDGWGLERVHYAAEIYRQTGAPVLVSGGDPYGGGANEAALMKNVLERELSIPVRWQEDRACDTWENAKHSRELLAPFEIDHIYLVTHAIDMGRAVRSFERAGFTVTAAPLGGFGTPRRGFGNWLPEAEALALTAWVLYEWIGSIYYKARGR